MGPGLLVAPVQVAGATSRSVYLPPGTWFPWEGGPSAPGGAKSYVNDSKMTGGFAILAYPAEYGSTGVMTFIVDDDGTVYQRDLGPNTSEATKSMTQFDADSSWQKAE